MSKLLEVLISGNLIQATMTLHLGVQSPLYRELPWYGKTPCLIDDSKYRTDLVERGESDSSYYDTSFGCSISTLPRTPLVRKNSVPSLATSKSHGYSLESNVCVRV
eukprot:CAMPEP_0185280522 /NCGR_PEP_ID=MMETSP1359-20130426/66179_1 /TAXON_ID=552665 /ORGANISM="Bigelowiella longifila, Strain CCMP242" /LENGTH=105 /DNA_ID=CAMNT_0027875791 /DNA_START=166 /DNA_END=483 /DNA_ORIENTATION=-